MPRGICSNKKARQKGDADCYTVASRVLQLLSLQHGVLRVLWNMTTGSRLIVAVLGYICMPHPSNSFVSLAVGTAAPGDTSR